MIIPPGREGEFVLERERQERGEKGEGQRKEKEKRGERSLGRERERGGGGGGGEEALVRVPGITPRARDSLPMPLTPTTP